MGSLIKQQPIQSPVNTGRNDFLAGVKAGLPIAAGYLPIAVAFGILSKSLGVPATISVSMSLIVFAGASQFIGVNMISAGVNPWLIVLTTFVVNFRHMLMSSTLSQKIKGDASKLLLAAVSFGITDETFSIASLKKDISLSPLFMLGLNIISYSSWTSGTYIGNLLSAGLPPEIMSCMGIALYAMFIGLLVPPVSKSRPALVVLGFSIFVSSVINWSPLSGFLPAGWSIIIATITGAAAGSLLFGKGDI